MWVRKLLHLQPQFSGGPKVEDPVVRLDKLIAGVSKSKTPRSGNVRGRKNIEVAEELSNRYSRTAQ